MICLYRRFMSNCIMGQRKFLQTVWKKTLSVKKIKIKIKIYSFKWVIQETRIMYNREGAMYKLSSFQPANNQSTMMRVIRNKCRIWNNEWQLINVHKKSLQVLSGDWRQINNLPATDVDPKIICVNSAETVPAEGAWLRSYTPRATMKQQNMMTNLEGIVRTWKDRQMPYLALKERENYGY